MKKHGRTAASTRAELAGHKKTASETGAVNGAKTVKNRKTNGGKDLPVFSQDVDMSSPALH
jgi:hypothetical protein